MKMLGEVSNMKTLPDADVEWIITTLETPILQKIREPLEKMYASGASNVPPEGMGPGPGMIPPEDLMAMPMGGMGPGPVNPAPVGGIRKGADMTGAVDELRRVMGGGYS